MSGSPLRSRWSLDPEITFLNHGSFGACPTEVLQAQSECRARLEAEPVRFFVRELEPLMDEARERAGRLPRRGSGRPGLRPQRHRGREHGAALAALRARATSCSPPTTSTTPRATRWTGPPAARARRSWWPGCPGPLRRPGSVVEAVLEQVTPRTRLLLIDHITSQTALVLPDQGAHRSACRARAWRRSWMARMAPGRCPCPCARSAPATTPATATSGSALPRARPSSTCAGSSRPGSSRSSVSHGAQLARARIARASGWTSTGPGPQDPSAGLCVPTALAGHGRTAARRLARADGGQPGQGAGRAPHAVRAPRRRPPTVPRRWWAPWPPWACRTAIRPSLRLRTTWTRSRTGSSTSTTSRCPSPPGPRRPSGTSGCPPRSTTRTRSTSVSANALEALLR